MANDDMRYIMGSVCDMDELAGGKSAKSVARMKLTRRSAVAERSRHASVQSSIMGDMIEVFNILTCEL